MFNRKILIAMTVMIIGLFMFVPISQAERQEFEGISCDSSTVTPVQASPGEILVASFEGKGINRITSKPPIDLTYHQAGVIKGQGGVFSWNGFLKVLYPDGDFAIWEFSGDSKFGGSNMKAIYGTGKLKGIKGEAKSMTITKAPPIVMGTMQQCQKVVGWIEF